MGKIVSSSKVFRQGLDAIRSVFLERELEEE